MSTLKEPYRLEGKKTMGYEIAEQLGWELPDVIVYPTGGGTGLVGMWKAFDEMEKLGWIGPKRPRMVTVQAAGCAPIVRAFEEKKEFAEPWIEPRTSADGLRVPAAVGDFLMLRVLRESRGTAIAVTDEEMMSGANLIGRTQGLFVSPETGATLAAFQRLRENSGSSRRIPRFSSTRATERNTRTCGQDTPNSFHDISLHPGDDRRRRPPKKPKKILEIALKAIYPSNQRIRLPVGTVDDA